MSEINTKNVKNTKEEQNQQNEDQGNFNFGQIVGEFGKYSRFNTVNNKDVLNFTISVPRGFGWYDYVPMTAWGSLADQLHQVQPKTMVGLGYSMHNSTSKVTTNSGHQMTVPQANAFTTYSQLNGYYNQGGLSGNFSKFSTYKLVGKNNNIPMLQFKLSVRNYNGDFDNYRLVAWNNVATQIHKAVQFKDFIGVTYSLGVDKLPLQNGHSLNTPELDVTGFKMLKKSSDIVKNPFKKPATSDTNDTTTTDSKNSDEANNKKSATDTNKKQFTNTNKDSKKKSTDDKKNADKKQKKSSVKDKNKSANKNKASKKPNKSADNKKPKTKGNHPKIDIEDDDLPF